MAEKKSKEKKVETLPPRIHLNQFLASYPEVSVEQKAGFKAYVQGKLWMRPKEWEKSYKKYFTK